MKNRIIKIRKNKSSGFALIATITILAAITILVTGLLSITSNERGSSSNFINHQRVELAVKTALEDATKTLMKSTDNDHFITFKVKDKDGDSFFYHNAKYHDNKWNYYPLFSYQHFDAENPYNTTSKIFNPDLPKLSPVKGQLNTAYTDDNDLDEQKMDAKLPWQEKPRAGWKIVEMPNISGADDEVQQQDEYEIRYRYWIEDLQGYIPGDLAGNAGDSGTGDHNKDTYGNFKLEDQVNKEDRYFSVPGMVVADSNGDLFDQPGKFYDDESTPMSKIALYSLFDPVTSTDANDEDKSDLDNEVIENRYAMLTKGVLSQTLHDTSQVDLSYSNRTNGKFADGSKEKRIDENFTSNWGVYKERPVLPMGKFKIKDYEGNEITMNYGNGNNEVEKLNINRVMYEVENGGSRSDKVTEIKNHIESYIPDFKERGGDFPEDYVKTIAANIIDYADTDSQSTYSSADPSKVDSSGYRGVDSYPFVNELLFVVTRENTGDSDSEKSFVKITVEPWVELWNPSDQMIEGSIAFKYDFHYKVSNDHTTIKQPKFIELKKFNQSGVTVTTDDIDKNTRWSKFFPLAYPDAPNTSVPLKPNEYRMVKMGSVTYSKNSENTEMNKLEVTFVDGAINETETSDSMPQDVLDYQIKWQDKNSTTSYVIDRSLEGVSFIKNSNGDIYEASKRDYQYKFVVGSSSGSRYGDSKGGKASKWTAGNSPYSYAFNPGDPRIGYYVQDFQGKIETHKYGSLFGRNSYLRKKYIRQDKKTASTIDTISREYNYMYNKITPMMWPDGGREPDDEISDLGYPAYSDKVKNKQEGGDFYSNKNSIVPYGGENMATPDKIWENFSTKILDKIEKNYSYAPTRISNRGYYFSETELGHIFDPVMWASENLLTVSKTTTGTIAQKFDIWQESIDESTHMNVKYGVGEHSEILKAGRFGGGNSLRIGRPEHKYFVKNKMSASQLLDIISAGHFVPDGGDGDHLDNLVDVFGKINLNTATYHTLRTVIAGALYQDKNIEPLTTVPVSANVTTAEGETLTANEEAGLVAQLIIDNRPFVAYSQVAETKDSNNENIFKVRKDDDFPKINTKYSSNPYVEAEIPLWSDAAAEETFARLYNSSTLRSRNYRVFVEAQVVKTSRSGVTSILSKMNKVYNLFLEPQREEDGKIKVDSTTNEAEFDIKVNYERVL